MVILPSIQVVWAGLQDDLHVVRIREGSIVNRVEREFSSKRMARKKENLHESESPRPPRLVVLHHNTVDDFTISTEISLQAVLSRLPAQAADEELPIFPNEGRKRGRHRFN